MNLNGAIKLTGQDASMPVYVNIPILLIIFMLGYVLSQQ